LDDEDDGAVIGVGAGDGERDALAVVVEAHDHELPRLLLPGDARRDDAEQLDVGGEKPSFADGVHESGVRVQGSGFRKEVQVLTSDWPTEQPQLSRQADERTSVPADERTGVRGIVAARHSELQ